MQLTIIGSSPAWPNPGSAHAGYLVEEENRRLLLDCGPGVLGRLRSLALLPVGAVAITHLHLDHWGDLVPWVWFRQHGYAEAGHPELWLPPGGQEALAPFEQRLGHAGMLTSAFQPREYGEDAAFEAAGFELVAHRVLHYGREAFGFRVRGRSGRVLGYSGDSGPCDGLERIAAGTDLFLCEATLASGADDASPRGHLSADEALAAGASRVLLTHRPAELATPESAERASDGYAVSV